MSNAVLDDIGIIDVDTHVVEPYDLWTSRVSTEKWGDKVPCVRWDPELQEDAWYFGDLRISGAATAAMAGWREFAPDHPPRLEDAEVETWDAKHRVGWMDRYGVKAQVLYPNVQGFGTGRFTALDDPELMLACVRAYNDFLTEYCAEAPGRFVAISALPFWDLDLTLDELQRCADMGHRGLIFGAEPEYFGQPHLTHPHWDRLWAAAQEIGFSVNFHIAAGDRKHISDPWDGIGRRAKYSSASVKFFLGNVKGMSDIIHSGIAHRFPDLKFVSVESGVGWIPYALDAMDWMWRNTDVRSEHPEYDLMPSEYFRRQFFACFWFETKTAQHAIEMLGPDNILFETDFPHPTSLSPGPGSVAGPPKTHAAAALDGLDPEIARKILHDNAARLYRL